MLHHVGDFDGDALEDPWVFNGDAWAFPYLGMLASTGWSLAIPASLAPEAATLLLGKPDNHVPARHGLSPDSR